MSNYNIIFEGNISSGYQLQDVKRNLAGLLKINEKQVDILFAKPLAVLKKGLGHDSAQKYRNALLKTGAICNVKAVVGPSGAQPVERAVPPDAAAQALKQAGPPAIPNQSSMPVSEEAAHFKSEQADENSSQNSPRKGFGDIITGIVIIGIGFTYGGSVFLGNPGPLDYFFDGLGVFWIGRGIYKLVRN